MKIGIIGAGAMGSLLGFYLSEHAEVWLLDPWQAHVEAINANGLRRELGGTEETRYPRATTDASAIGACDAVLVLVKAQQTPWAAEQAHALLKPDRLNDRVTRWQDDKVIPPIENSSGTLSPSHLVILSKTLVVTLQNGVGNRELLAETLGAGCVGQGVTALGATLIGPGRVRHAGQGATVFGAAPDPAGMAALAARELLAEAVAEAVAVAAARGTPLPYADPLEHVLAVARATGANRSSMLQDAMRGSPTEIDTINGAVVREGQRLGVPTPVNRLLAALVRALDATAAVRVRE